MMTRFIIHCLVVLSFITAGVSPACEFISGQSVYIEICGADGDIKRIKAPEGISPLALSDQNNEQPSHTKKNECDFCVFHASSKLAKANAAPPTVKIQKYERFIALNDSVFKASHIASYQSRAPPILS